MHKASYLVIVGIKLVWHDLVLMNVNGLLLFSYYPRGAYKLLSYLFQYFCGNMTSAKFVHLLQFPEPFKDKHCIFSFQERIPKYPPKKFWNFPFLELNQLFYIKTCKAKKICFISGKNLCKICLCIQLLSEMIDTYEGLWFRHCYTYRIVILLQ